MSQINAYLTFNGNCREAMTFYNTCLGGDLRFQTIGESPMADKLPIEMQQSILHATLSKGNLTLMGSDMVGESGLKRGTAISLMIDCDSEAEIKTLFKKLAEGGTITHSLEITFWGALFGDLIDKYGNPWILHFDKNQHQ